MSARQIALDILSNVLKNKSYLNLTLKRYLEKGAEDKRFITALVSTTLENLFRIDYVLDRFITAKRVHAVIRNILRLGVCQLMFFESVPVSAAVNESVKLAGQNGKKQLKGFVNATLRNLAENLGKVVYPDAAADFVEYLHILYSYPRWLCEKYVQDYGKDQAEAMFGYVADHALTCVRQNKLKTREPFWEFEPGLYCDDAYYLRNVSSIERTPLFRHGEIAVQGEASMVCVRAAGIRDGDDVLDLCAAPGGKSAYAAQFAKGGTVTAADLYEHRVGLIRSNMERLGVRNVRAEMWDATVFRPEWEAGFNVVLADVPCSALGLLYRKPDLKIFKQEEDLARLARIQRDILTQAARYVKPGGALLYSTCTIDTLENRDNMEWFLSAHPDFQRSELRNLVPEALMCRTENGEMQLLPHIDRIDGFYMARLVRV